MTRQPIAYLASEYPAISHTFIFREIQSLRAQGFSVRTASIRQPAHISIMTTEEQAEASRTLYIKTTNPVKALGIHIALKLGTLPSYIRMFFKALSLWWSGPLDLFKAIAYCAEAGILAAWTRREGVRHVHVHFANPAATVAMIAASGGYISYSLSMHGPDEFYNIQSDLIPEKVRNASFVRCISHYCRSQVLRVLEPREWDKCHIVRCGIDIESFAPRPEPENRTPEILCIGRLVPAKGQHVLLNACKRLRDRGVAFHLTLVGGGPDRDSLVGDAHRLGIADAVTFTGPVGQDEIHAYYNRADVFALASFAEGLPVVLMEAMGKGIPCVTTAITGHPELIDNGENGFLVAASDIEGLAGRLETLLTSPELRSQMGQKARKKVLAQHDLAVNCAQMAELFERYLK